VNYSVRCWFSIVCELAVFPVAHCINQAVTQSPGYVVSYSFNSALSHAFIHSFVHSFIHSKIHISVVQHYWNSCGIPADFKVENMHVDMSKEMWLFLLTIPMPEILEKRRVLLCISNY